MIVEKDFLNKLKDFGLNTYESKLWAALLSRGVSTAGELSDIANVPRSRSYDVLEALEKKGFIITKLGKPIKYIAVPPEEVIERVKQKIQKKSDRHLKMMTELKKSPLLGELNSLHTKGIQMVEPSELSASIKDQANILHHFDARLRAAEQSVSIMTTGEGFVRKAGLLLKHFENNSDVRVRIAVPKNADAKLVEDLRKVADVRYTEKEGRFCVIDGKEVTFMLLNDKEVHPSYDVAVWINSEFFAKNLQSMFDSEWGLLKR